MGLHSTQLCAQRAGWGAVYLANPLATRKASVLRPCSGVLIRVPEQVIHLQVDAISPTEADDVALVPCSHRDVGGAVDDVVLLPDGVIEQEVLQDGRRELRCNAGGIAGESILHQAFGGKPVGS